jgi:hypothetical protein
MDKIIGENISYCKNRSCQSVFHNKSDRISLPNIGLTTVSGKEKLLKQLL